MGLFLTQRCCSNSITLVHFKCMAEWSKLKLNLFCPHSFGNISTSDSSLDVCDSLRATSTSATTSVKIWLDCWPNIRTFNDTCRDSNPRLHLMILNPQKHKRFTKVGRINIVNNDRVAAHLFPNLVLFITDSGLWFRFRDWKTETYTKYKVSHLTYR